jgi:hypothetical protein
MNGKVKLGIAVKHPQKGSVAANMCIIEHMRKVAYRLMGMYAQQ